MLEARVITQSRERNLAAFGAGTTSSTDAMTQHIIAEGAGRRSVFFLETAPMDPPASSNFTLWHEQHSLERVSQLLYARFIPHLYKFILP